MADTHRVKAGTIYKGAKVYETGDTITPTAQDLAAFGDKLEVIPAPAPKAEKADDSKKESK